MVAKSSKVYTKLQGNVNKMNVRLSSQFSHEHFKLANVQMFMGKMGESLKLILSTFFVHSFPSHLCDPIYRFVTLTITKLCSWEHCTKIVTSISTARKIPHS